jgi:hypothetical protein
MRHPATQILEDESMADEQGVKHALSWVFTMLETPASERQEWVKHIVKSMRENAASFVDPYKNLSAKDRVEKVKEIAKNLEYLTNMLARDCDIVGLTPNINYIRVSGRPEFLKPWWIHPFSSPTIVAKHKTLPVMFLIGPSIQKDKATIYTVEDGSIVQNPIEGVTG